LDLRVPQGPARSRKPLKNNICLGFERKMTDTIQTALYVSTNLDTWEARPPIKAGQDRECETCGFRRLDPEYYAWLRARMTIAQQHHQAGRLPGRRYEQLRARFNVVHAWAVAHLGPQQLQRAVKTTDTKSYQPPTVSEEPPPPPVPPHLYPATGDWLAMQPVSTGAVAKVDAIREQALALGWSEAQLYQNRGRYRFPYGPDYGLVCFLEADAQVGEITAQLIEIINAGGHRLHFYNLAIEQPWLRAATVNEEK
jgi:hypothetical protein